MNAPRLVPSLDELAADPARAAELPADAVETLMVKHAMVGTILLSRLLSAKGNGTLGREPDGALLDARQAAERLAVPSTWIRDMARQGKLPSVRLGHYVRFRAADLDAFAAEHRRDD